MIKTFNAITCDICKTTLDYYERKDGATTTWIARHSGEKLKPWSSMSMNVKFLTEQTEGTSTTPYFDNVNMHVCPDCLNKLLDTWPIVAYGAQGNNQYQLKA